MEGLKLFIERQIEMLNVFIGFEQSNKYTISGENGEPLGYIAEEPRGFLGTLSRQAFATHRPFRAVIMDNEGLPVLWVRRPFAWINSRMLVQRLKAHANYDPETEPILGTFGEVQQIWHPWRRRYDLFLRSMVQFPPVVSQVLISVSATPSRRNQALVLLRTVALIYRKNLSIIKLPRLIQDF
ncbi:unnamed protein product [Cyclocybe aegerita]|uniref:Phospholipid scramblase n=1 Tax=Cyclocybe aegerita TaxID=1973307 RepID=A0A8S0WFD9_CYCAE|nr:unnamed protein product [Cyclocybe aegerita]